MFKKNKRKYIKLGNVMDKKIERKQESSNPTFDGEKFYKEFNEIKVEEVKSEWKQKKNLWRDVL